MPAVTVLMPVYNAERFLKESIGSILNQSFTDFEFLIIDDGSTDSSAAIIKSYSDPRIRLVQNEKNLGISATLNRGIALASCELIARMDADDISYPDRLQKQYDYFQQDADCALLSTWVRYVNMENNSWWVNKYKAAHYYYTLTFNCWIFHPSVMYKRSAVIEVGMYDVPYSEDFNLWWKLSRKYKIHNLSEVLLDYRAVDTSLCRTSRKQEYEEAHNAQMLENIHYYTGQDFELQPYELQFIRGRVEPILAEGNSRELIVQSFKKFDAITSGILRTENVNKINNRMILEAAFNKKRQLMYSLSRQMPGREMALLLYQLKDWRLLIATVTKICREEGSRLKRRIAKVMPLTRRATSFQLSGCWVL